MRDPRSSQNLTHNSQIAQTWPGMGEEREQEQERRWERGGVGEQAQKGMPLRQYLVQFYHRMEWNHGFQSN